MENEINKNGGSKDLLRKYVYGRGGKALLLIFVVGVILGTLAPSLVSPEMVIIAVAITLVIQRVRDRKEPPNSK